MMLLSVLVVLSQAAAAGSTATTRASRAGVTWGGPRASVEFEHATLASWLSFGLDFSAISLQDVPARERKTWRPSRASSMNRETRFFDAHCEAVADRSATRWTEQCGMRCSYDYLVVIGWGTVAAMYMDFGRDGVLLLTCGIIQVPKDCVDSPEECAISDVKAVGPDFTAECIESMQGIENGIKLVANSSQALDMFVRKPREQGGSKTPAPSTPVIPTTNAVAAKAAKAESSASLPPKRPNIRLQGHSDASEKEKPAMTKAAPTMQQVREETGAAPEISEEWSSASPWEGGSKVPAAPSNLESPSKARESGKAAASTTAPVQQHRKGARTRHNKGMRHGRPANAPSSHRSSLYGDAAMRALEELLDSIPEGGQVTDRWRAAERRDRRV